METIDSHIKKAPAAPAKSETWKRGLIMLAFMIAFGAGQSILYLIAVAQFLWLLIAKEPNTLLVEFGKSLAVWLAQTADKISTYKANRRPCAVCRSAKLFIFLESRVASAFTNLGRAHF